MYNEQAVGLTNMHKEWAGRIPGLKQCTKNEPGNPIGAFNTKLKLHKTMA